MGQQQLDIFYKKTLCLSHKTYFCEKFKLKYIENK